MLPGDGRTRGPVINPKAKSSRGQAVLEFWTHAEDSIFSGDRPLLLLQREEGTGVSWCSAWGQGSIPSVASTSDKIGRASPGPATGFLPPTGSPLAR